MVARAIAQATVVRLRQRRGRQEGDGEDVLDLLVEGEDVDRVG